VELGRRLFEQIKLGVSEVSWGQGRVCTRRRSQDGGKYYLGGKAEALAREDLWAELCQKGGFRNSAVSAAAGPGGGNPEGVDLLGGGPS